MAVYIKNHAGGKGMDPAGVLTAPTKWRRVLRVANSAVREVQTTRQTNS